jgi:hypothetical protein
VYGSVDNFLSHVEVAVPNSEKRDFGRRTHRKVGNITQGERVLPATILSLSELGAHFETVASIIKSDQPLALEIAEDDFVVSCRVTRIEGDQVGVEFVKSPQRLSWARQNRPSTEAAFSIEERTNWPR